MGYSPRGRKESDTTEHRVSSLSLFTYLKRCCSEEDGKIMEE